MIPGMKDAGIRIRVEKQLRSAFAAACQAENKQASDVLREFMEMFVARHRVGQGDLFSVRRERSARSKAAPPVSPTRGKSQTWQKRSSPKTPSPS